MYYTLAACNHRAVSVQNLSTSDWARSLRVCLVILSKDYFFLLRAWASSFIFRTASSRVIGFACSLISFQTASRSRPSNGLNILSGSRSTAGNIGLFDNRKDRKNPDQKEGWFTLRQFEEISSYFFKTRRFCVQKKDFVSIASYDQLNEASGKSETDQVVVSTKVIVLRKGIPDSVVHISEKHLRHLLDCNLLVLKLGCRKRTKVEFKIHKSNDLIKPAKPHPGWLPEGAIKESLTDDSKILSIPIITKLGK